MIQPAHLPSLPVPLPSFPMALSYLLQSRCKTHHLQWLHPVCSKSLLHQWWPRWVCKVIAERCGQLRIKNILWRVLFSTVRFVTCHVSPICIKKGGNMRVLNGRGASPLYIILPSFIPCVILEILMHFPSLVFPRTYEGNQVMEMLHQPIQLFPCSGCMYPWLMSYQSEPYSNQFSPNSNPPRCSWQAYYCLFMLWIRTWNSEENSSSAYLFNNYVKLVASPYAA